MQGELIAIGADGARGGWIAACLYRAGSNPETGKSTRLELCRDIEELARLRATADDSAAMAIDVPIGLPDTVKPRVCDEQARARLGKRWTTVFAPPARYMLSAAGDYGRIRELVGLERERDPSAKGLSAQAAGLTPKIAEVDAFVRARRDSEIWLWECHPELSFRALNGGVPCGTKHHAAGVVERMRLLRTEFPDFEQRLADSSWSSKEVTLTDMLDAYAALFTAARCLQSQHEELGDGERDAADLPMRMAV